MKNLKKFWLKKSKIIKWKVEPKLAFKKKSDNKILWYPDGKLNIAENCLMHSADKKKTAIISISKEKKIKKLYKADGIKLIKKLKKELKLNIIKLKIG